MQVTYRCYQCNRENTEEQSNTTNGMPFGWRLPPSHVKIVDVNAKERLAPHTIVALCSDGCYNRFVRNMNEE